MTMGLRLHLLLVIKILGVGLLGGHDFLGPGASGTVAISIAIPSRRSAVSGCDRDCGVVAVRALGASEVGESACDREAILIRG